MKQELALAHLQKTIQFSGDGHLLRNHMNSPLSQALGALTREQTSGGRDNGITFRDRKHYLVSDSPRVSLHPHV